MVVFDNERYQLHWQFTIPSTTIRGNCPETGRFRYGPRASRADGPDWRQVRLTTADQ